MSLQSSLLGSSVGRSLRLWKSLTVAAAFTACSGDAAPDDDQLESNLELYSWWTSAGEAEALEALLSVYSEKHPEVTVTNAAADDPTNARQRLKSRMDRGEPPDSFQAISGVDLLSWAAKGRMTSLNAMATQNGWRGVFPPEVLDILSLNGDLYGVPANIERDNNLYYNVAVLDAAKLEPPRSLDDFYAACATLQEDGITPLAVPAAGWVLALVAFENLMPSVLGGDYYLDFFSGRAKISGPEVVTLFTEFKKILTCSNIATADPSWTVNADLTHKGAAAMYIMGDWAKGYFEGGRNADGAPIEAWTAGSGFGVVPGLGSADYFTFNSAVFGLPQGAQHIDAAKAFLEVVGSTEGQEAFNPVKGSVPARTDVDLDAFDDMVRNASSAFKTAAEGKNRLLPGYASLTTFEYQQEINPSLLVFAVGGRRARELDPENIPETEVVIEPLNVDYIVGKLRVTYVILED